MAFKAYDASFASVLPRLRARLDIVADLDRSVSGGATDSARGMIAEIELHISDGDNFYKRKQYDSALNEFKKARALIYKALHPQFDVSAYIGRKDVVLPVSKAIEDSLLDVSLRIADVIRPAALESGPIFKQNGLDSMPQALQTYMATGFREAVSLDESLQLASAGGVALLNDNKPEAAVRLMEEALISARAANAHSDPILTAALELNLSGAYLQLANPQKATELAAASLEHFKRSGDQVGQAQALHLSAMSAQKNGETDRAKQLFAQAANILTKLSAPVMGEAPAPGRPIPSPTPVAPHLLPGFTHLSLSASQTMRSTSLAELASSSFRVSLPGRWHRRKPMDDINSTWRHRKMSQPQRERGNLQISVAMMQLHRRTAMPLQVVPKSGHRQQHRR
ncbi:MAG TPA: tetratricopeptide repeat protein [Ktedonobacteraceae bacterium]|nr:tetratricopeptide repeat protein [Ktedonobacteraceae bacterium]